jgi:hypothetical protein
MIKDKKAKVIRKNKPSVANKDMACQSLRPAMLFGGAD